MSIVHRLCSTTVRELKPDDVVITRTIYNDRIPRKRRNGSATGVRLDRGDKHADAVVSRSARRDEPRGEDLDFTRSREHAVSAVPYECTRRHAVTVCERTSERTL